MNTYRWDITDAAAGDDQAAEHIHPHYLEIQDVILAALPFDGGIFIKGDEVRLDDDAAYMSELRAWAEHMQQKIFNETFAKPFNWTYTGRPTQTAAVEKPKTWRQLWQSKRNAQTYALVA